MPACEGVLEEGSTRSSLGWGGNRDGYGDWGMGLGLGVGIELGLVTRMRLGMGTRMGCGGCRHGWGHGWSRHSQPWLAASRPAHGGCLHSTLHNPCSLPALMQRGHAEATRRPPIPLGRAGGRGAAEGVMEQQTSPSPSLALG